LKNKAFSILIFVIIAVTIAILAVMWLNLSGTIESLAKEKISETTKKAEAEMDAYFNCVRSCIIQVKELTDYGLMEAEFNTDMNLLLLPLFNTSQQIKTFALARTSGYEFSMIREDSTWLNNFVYETDSGMNIMRERWKGDCQNREIVRKWIDYNADYDPRKRPWFTGANSSKDTTVPYWTNPYKLAFQTFPGITASMQAKSKVTGEHNVVQWDVLLSEISHFMKDLAFSENGRVFLLSENFEILGLPKDDRFIHTDSLKKYVLAPYDSARYGPMTTAVNIWKEEGEDFLTPFSFDEQDERWWGLLHKYELDNERYFIIGVVVPESDFLSEIKRTRDIILGCSIVVMIFLLIIAKGYFDKRKANRILFRQKCEIEQQKEEIEAQRDHIEQQKDELEIRNEELFQAKEEIEAQRDEIEAQRDLVVEQKEEIEKIHFEIQASIQYAKRIQEAILPSAEFMDDMLEDYFVFFRPRDVVSGDFYWMTEQEGNIIIAAADCTGHGVPGAFMSMLGSAFLNEVVSSEYITHPGVILGKLRKKIINALHQKGEEMEQKDGMDIALCTIKSASCRVQFAGANNPLYIVRKKNREALENTAALEGEHVTLYEVAPDKMPIAIYIKMDRFETQEYSLEKGDCLYIFSDGYADQFGGPKSKKFKYKPFKKLLTEISDLPMKEQGKRLEQEFDNWKNHSGQIHDQIDDVIVIGIRL